MTARQRNERLLMEFLAENIRCRRRELGWTQQQLADKAKLTRVTIARLETSSVRTEWPTICAVADALGCSTDDLRKNPELIAC